MWISLEYYQTIIVLKIKTNSIGIKDTNLWRGLICCVFLWG